MKVRTSMIDIVLDLGESRTMIRLDLYSAQGEDG